MAIGFTVTLSERDWDPELSGWRCPALKIPGAAIDAVYVSGTRADTSWYEVLAEHSIVRWVRENHPAQAAIAIKLTEELSTQELTSKWRKLAIVLPVVSSVLVAVIAAAVSLYTADHTSSQAHSTQATTTTASLATSPQPPRKNYAVATDFNIMMPRGDKVVIDGKNVAGDGEAEEQLRQQGINLQEVDSGTKQAYAALTKRSVESIRYGPLVFGDKLAPGYSHAVMRAGPAEGSGYKEFQLFQRDDHFIILIHTGDEQSKPIEPTKIGINWDAVRAGLSRALLALYRNQATIEFDSVGIFTEADGSWEYHLPYRLKHSV